MKLKNCQQDTFICARDIHHWNLKISPCHLYKIQKTDYNLLSAHDSSHTCKQECFLLDPKISF